MKETPHKTGDDPAPEQTHKAAVRTFLGRIQTALFRKKKEEKTNPQNPILEDFLAFDRAQKEEGHKSDSNQRGIPGKEERKDIPLKPAGDQTPERPHPAMERPLLEWIRTALFRKKKEETNQTQINTGDILAYERTRMAADRTLMGWIRTDLSMIGFGFTIYKFLESIQHTEYTKQSPATVGLFLIGMGVVSLAIACAQHWRYLKMLRPDHPYKGWDLPLVVAFLIGMFGLSAFISIILKAGPLG